MIRYMLYYMLAEHRDMIDRGEYQVENFDQAVILLAILVERLKKAWLP